MFSDFYSSKHVPRLNDQNSCFEFRPFSQHSRKMNVFITITCDTTFIFDIKQKIKSFSWISISSRPHHWISRFPIITEILSFWHIITQLLSLLYQCDTYRHAQNCIVSKLHNPDLWRVIKLKNNDFHNEGHWKKGFYSQFLAFSPEWCHNLC